MPVEFSLVLELATPELTPSLTLDMPIYHQQVRTRCGNAVSDLAPYWHRR